MKAIVQRVAQASVTGQCIATGARGSGMAGAGGARRLPPLPSIFSRPGLSSPPRLPAARQCRPPAVSACVDSTVPLSPTADVRGQSGCPHARGSVWSRSCVCWPGCPSQACGAVSVSAVPSHRCRHNHLHCSFVSAVLL